jgi:hypothetical protein
MIKMKWKDARRVQANINVKEAKVLAKAGIFAKDIAEWHLRDVDSSWSASAPSRPGRPPAQRSGNLASSPYIEYRTGGAKFIGLFAGPSGGSPADFPIAIVHWNTRKGAYSPTNKRGYAGYLEAGTAFMHKRPFIGPSIRRIKKAAMARAKEILKK